MASLSFKVTACLQAGDNPLEELKYSCNITEELARQLAKSLQPTMQLNSYLLYV